MSTVNSFKELQEKFRSRFGEHVKFNEPLAPYLAYRVGGPADILVFPRNEEDLLWLREVTTGSEVPFTVIGTGTNLLVRDGGIRGVTVSLLRANQEIQLIDREKLIVEVGGGVEKPKLLDWAIANGFSGLEFSAGVPGTIGGGIFMNAGTKYGSYGDILDSFRIFDFEKGAYTVSRSEVTFSYRHQNAVKDSIVLWARFALQLGNREKIQSEVQRIIEERAEKQPLDYPSCGSTFKNPEGYSAGRLIEKSGLKGLQIGGAEISTKHANFILNKNNARASDIISLIGIIQKKVKELFGVELETEVVILGEDNVGK